MMDDEKLLNVSVVFQTEFFIMKNNMLIQLHDFFLYSNVILIFDRINFLVCSISIFFIQQSVCNNSNTILMWFLF